MLKKFTRQIINSLNQIRAPKSALPANDMLAMYIPYDRIATEEWLINRMKAHIEQDGLLQIVAGQQWCLLNDIYKRQLITDKIAANAIISVPIDDLLEAQSFALLQLVVNYHSVWLKDYAKIPHEAETIKATRSKLDELARCILNYIKQLEPEQIELDDLAQLLAIWYTAKHYGANINSQNPELLLLLRCFIDDQSPAPIAWQDFYIARLKIELIQKVGALQGMQAQAPQQAKIILQQIGGIVDVEFAQQVKDIINDPSLRDAPSIKKDDIDATLLLMKQLGAAESKILNTERGFHK